MHLVDLVKLTNLCMSGQLMDFTVKVFHFHVTDFTLSVCLVQFMLSTKIIQSEMFRNLVMLWPSIVYSL